MIKRVSANHGSFRDLSLTPGLNVVLADRTQESTRKDSRNGLGKSMLVEIIHFCLGSGARKGSGLIIAPLKGWAFSLDLVLAGRNVRATRHVDEPGRVVIEGDTRGWPVKRGWDRALDGDVLDVRDWTAVLGSYMFGLPIEDGGKHEPTFRSLISYFVRRGRDSFSTPFSHHRKQAEADIQVNVAYLLGMAWEDARDLQMLKERKAMLAGLRRAVKEGLVGGFDQSRGDLEARRTRLQEQAAQEAVRLSNFKVHPEYANLRERANDLTLRIHEIANEAVSNRHLLSVYEQDLTGERPPDETQLERVYQEAGVVLPGQVVRRIEDVREFHRKVVENRRSFLAEEAGRLRREIAAIEVETARLSDERSGLMTLLQTHGALEEYTGLQGLHLSTLEEIKRLDTLITNWRTLETGLSEIKIEQERVHQRGLRDYDERAEIRAKAVSLFNANSEALYAAPGRLQIDFLQKGFDFGVEIERSGSDGIENMKVFCFDLMLAQLWGQKAARPGFLVHDSRIFDGVDERQKALALQLAARAAPPHGFQYLCCINSDAVPAEELEAAGFDLRPFVRLTLTDADPAGSLFGFRF